MSHTDHVIEVGLCNAGAKNIVVWLEPWCDEFVLPAHAELSLRAEGEPGTGVEPLIEAAEHGLTIYGVGNSRLRAFVDGVEQDTASAIITAPDFGPMGSRGFVDIVFGDFPQTRPHGHPVPTKFRWLKRFFGKA